MPRPGSAGRGAIWCRWAGQTSTFALPTYRPGAWEARGPAGPWPWGPRVARVGSARLRSSTAPCPERPAGAPSPPVACAWRRLARPRCSALPCPGRSGPLQQSVGGQVPSGPADHGRTRARAGRRCRPGGGWVDHAPHGCADAARVPAYSRGRGAGPGGGGGGLRQAPWAARAPARDAAGALRALRGGDPAEPHGGPRDPAVRGQRVQPRRQPGGGGARGHPCSRSPGPGGQGSAVGRGKDVRRWA